MYTCACLWILVAVSIVSILSTISAKSVDDKSQVPAYMTSLLST